ncbi:hypothetical protein Goari_022956, partial [Gossypium aridum]|nr:hypothetical protein [Gossypium aridum]
MKQSEVFQSRTVEKKTGMTVKQEKRKRVSFRKEMKERNFFLSAIYCESGIVNLELMGFGIHRNLGFQVGCGILIHLARLKTSKRGLKKISERKGYVGEWEESVTGGIGYIGSWLIEVLLQQGYSVHTTVRPDPDEKLKIFKADLRSPESFNAAMEGCRRVLHVSAPMDFQDNEPEAVLTQRSVDGALGIVKSCLRSKTVKRVVHTSSISAMCFNKENVERMDESYWTDVDYVRSELNSYVSSYAISKTETEKAVSEVATEHGLDLVTIIPSIVVGPFICPKIHGNKDYYSLLINVATVHIDDSARAMIFPREKGDLIVPQT